LPLCIGACGASRAVGPRFAGVFLAIFFDFLFLVEFSFAAGERGAAEGGDRAINRDVRRPAEGFADRADGCLRRDFMVG